MLGLTSVRQLIGYTVALVMLIFGLMIITGKLVPRFIDSDRFRIIFGVVLVLFSIFRFLSAYFVERRTRRSILEDDSWKGSSTTSSDQSE